MEIAAFATHFGRLPCLILNMNDWNETEARKSKQSGERQNNHAIITAT